MFSSLSDFRQRRRRLRRPGGVTRHNGNPASLPGRQRHRTYPNSFRRHRSVLGQSDRSRSSIIYNILLHTHIYRLQLCYHDK